MFDIHSTFRCKVGVRACKIRTKFRNDNVSVVEESSHNRWFTIAFRAIEIGSDDLLCRHFHFVDDASERCVIAMFSRILVQKTVSNFVVCVNLVVKFRLQIALRYVRRLIDVNLLKM